MLRHITLAAVGCGLAFSGGCRDAMSVCDLVLVTKLTPGDTTVRVGQSFEPRLAVRGGCIPVVPVAATLRTADASVVSIDQGAGRVTAIAPGVAHVVATRREGSNDVDYGTIVVRVQ